MKTISVVGAGLVGCLAACFLARKGYQVEVFEKRTDPRKRDVTVGEGRSINLAISVRGLHALSLLGLDEKVLQYAIPMRGRMMHSLDGTETFQSYGTGDKDAINSLSRGWLNAFLMEQAEATGRVKIHFGKELEAINFDQKTLTWKDFSKAKYEFLLGTDGSASVIRNKMQNLQMTQVSSEELSHSYKEFVMHPKSSKAQMVTQALHIWPRGNFMVIALPNVDGSFTCTLFLPTQGPLSFESLVNRDQVRSFFEENFKDFTQMVPDFVDQYFDHPTGKMFTVKTQKWSPPGFEKDVLLIGDSVHAIVPFFGQGMNCGFEDVVVLLEQFEKGLAAGFTDYYNDRRPNTDAIADMAVENFVEMSARVADPYFLFQKQVEKKIQETFPKEYVSRYSLVSFSRAPYRLALEVGGVQKEILNKICHGKNSVDQVSLLEAKQLIDQKLSPVLSRLKTFERS